MKKPTFKTERDRMLDDLLTMFVTFQTLFVIGGIAYMLFVLISYDIAHSIVEWSVTLLGIVSVYAGLKLRTVHRAKASR
jgi:hypothetical protein